MRSLGDITEAKVEQTGPTSQGEFVYVDIGSVDNRLKKIVDPKCLSPNAAPSRARQRLAAGDVLVSMTRPNLNAVALVTPELDGAIGSTGFHVLRARESVLPQWLYYGVQSRRFVSAMSELVQGALYPAVRPKDIRAFHLAVPEIEAQRNTVAEIEKHFSRLDEALINLKRVKANLQRYKTAVLKAAVEGHLVAVDVDPARQGRRSFGTGEELRERILTRRRALWNREGKYAEPELPDTSLLPKLPFGWTWVPFSWLGADPFNAVQTGPFGAQLHNSEFRQAGVPVIAVGNLTGTGFSTEHLYFITEAKAKQLAKYDVQAGDVLFARSGATLGKVCVAPPEVTDWRMTGHILRARLNKDLILPEIAMYALAALPAVRQQVFGNVRGVTRPGFNTSLLESILIPVPPRPEQDRIIAEVEFRLSLIEVARSQVDANMARAQVLRHAVLAKAFEV